MRYSNELDLRNFEAWSGGFETLKVAQEKNLISEIEFYLEEIFYGLVPTKTDINDMLWFDEYINELVYGIE